MLKLDQEPVHFFPRLRAGPVHFFISRNWLGLLLDRIATQWDPDPDPTFYCDSDPDPDPLPGFQIKAQNLEKVLK